MKNVNVAQRMKTGVRRHYFGDPAAAPSAEANRRGDSKSPASNRPRAPKDSGHGTTLVQERC